MRILSLGKNAMNKLDQQLTDILSYIGIPVYLIMLFGYKFLYKTKTVKPHEADLFTGKDIVDREEEEFLAVQAAEGENRTRKRKFYDNTIGILF